MSDQSEDRGVPPASDEIRPVFDAAPARARAIAIELRELIYRTASKLDEVSDLTESLKWGEPSYAPSRPGIGTSVRISPREDGSVGLMFICHTDIVSSFRELYRDELEFEGRRAIILRRSGQSTDAVTHCVSMAMTWHLGKRAKRRPA
ncbi:DUF1801 domain-containing protein [Pseudohoeflea suaedae]|uniref:DUF1801 domain-containing protein n=1 Tax=Pseudohoeflea suaedae TaxID=877384 RepID=A0A4R5PN45_9HYPH|nr:DUF1801 domain-containing protein [Pseudohoeflea suaedae]TDH38470.1 DUF1801 domain-containing protein [Pseudohoeflea suaedae]